MLKRDSWPTDNKLQLECAERFMEVVLSAKAAQLTTGLSSETLLSALKPSGSIRSALSQELLADRLQEQRQFNKEWFRTGDGNKRLSALDRVVASLHSNSHSAATISHQKGHMHKR